MATLTKIYSDIDFTFTKKPVTGDVALSYDDKAVIRSIRNLLSTKRYERLFDPTLGSNIDSLLFENVSPITSATLESEILNTIKNYEPRANLLAVDVKGLPDDNAYSASILFSVNNNLTPINLNLILRRIR